MTLQKIDNHSSLKAVRQIWVANSQEEILEELKRQKAMWPVGDFETMIDTLEYLDRASTTPGKWRCNFNRKSIELIHDVAFTVISATLVQAIDAAFMADRPMAQQTPGSDTKLNLLKHVLGPVHEDVSKLGGSYALDILEHRAGPTIAFDHPTLMLDLVKELRYHLGWSEAAMKVGMGFAFTGAGPTRNAYLQTLDYHPKEGRYPQRCIEMGAIDNNAFVLRFKELPPENESQLQTSPTALTITYQRTREAGVDRVTSWQAEFVCGGATCCWTSDQ